ncbi:hypothetical protein F4861DRAFT_522246 [Xylaria intraflava]|nr:hypothetical protein F4861DRAFT_522246 [Xylaria intraflava]
MTRDLYFFALNRQIQQSLSSRSWASSLLRNRILSRRSNSRPHLQRAQRMASSTTNGATAGASMNDIPKSWIFTSKLPADASYPTPAHSHETPRDQIGPRMVRNAIFTWVRPKSVEDPELLAVSPAAMRDLGIRAGDEKSADFVATVAGNRIQGWNEEKSELEPGGGYPWAQCYGGFQFGSWAGQLGDGRAISLFETTSSESGVRYELQLKGAGLTPYSRFADGKAVLRSSIREFIVSEALNALGIPTTRALSLTLLPHEKVRRETIEPGAIVARFAQSWLRIGNFDILRARGDRKLIRHLATYVAEDVFDGWDKLPARLEDPDNPTRSPAPQRGLSSDTVEGPSESAENRFARLYREIVRRNALTVAKWQAYGFMNGVLNTDNTSLFGLSIDFGPFAFMDNFDPNYTPNHDDAQLRYSYRNQPSIIWWNLVRLGESLGELIGAGDGVDELSFIENGVEEDQASELIARAEKIITQAGEEYKAVFLGEYKKVMTARLGLKNFKESDFDQLFSELLDTMETLELDFNIFFRRLSSVKLSELASEEARRNNASLFFYQDDVTGLGSEEEGRERIGEWLERWRQRVLEDWGDGSSVSEEVDAQRTEAMKKVNPSFIPRGWILDEIIRRVEKNKERDVLDRVMTMALHPFEDSWAGREFDGKIHVGDKDEETRWIADVPKYERALQCSCSS